MWEQVLARERGASPLPYQDEVEAEEARGLAVVRCQWHFYFHLQFLGRAAKYDGKSPA